MIDQPSNGITVFNFEKGAIWGWFASVPSGKRASEVAIEAMDDMRNSTTLEPIAIYVKDIPNGAEEFMEIEGACLLSVDWFLPNAVLAVCAGNQHVERLEGVEAQHIQMNKAGVCE